MLGVKPKISSHTEFLFSTLAELGWTVNFEKSLLEPSQIKPFMHIDNTDEQTVIIIQNQENEKGHKALRY